MRFTYLKWPIIQFFFLLLTMSMSQGQRANDPLLVSAIAIETGTLPITTTLQQPTTTAAIETSKQPITTSNPPLSTASKPPIVTSNPALPTTIGIALIGGVIACISRRGGCTKRSDKKKSDFEDYGLGDFPHNKSTMASAAAAATSAATAATSTTAAPTIPRLNEHGNYYQNTAPTDDYYYQGNGNYMDNGYSMQQPHQYYYNQPYHQDYYDDSYYYDNASGMGYSAQMQPQSSSPIMQHTTNMPMATPLPPPHQQQNIYKPDDISYKR
ncbi:uncharacterized protein BX663DRAFT_182854 [Cokeromyces recurvatus]|uniref:uncharacterized protein n=1 Tax=Cokeromyces recurvatus TaxID=90255 RepID=UPI0022209115|nr:uncharacterized protein BX663DRAFT_182854 [Cokeromyces recurvatus]KAI7899784.1 hypothetical protein BX663DRAFT_182854 [Cokeromyces recurvatus]